MLTVGEIARFLDAFAPPALAESWDNVGLLVGNYEHSVRRIMTCLTITPASAREAVAAQADLIVSHHPLPFRPLNRLTAETSEGRLLLELIGAKISVYSPHTAFDSAQQGINQRLAAGLQLEEITPLVPGTELGQGAGRFGRLRAAIPLFDLVGRVKQLLAIANIQAVGPLNQTVERVAVACGSAGEFVAPAKAALCDCLVTGEVRFHTCLEAESLGVGLVLAGHFASERFAVVELAGILAEKFPSLQAWASQQERDPLHWL
ncbi:MAG: Nif3-like dinuclear metal center hexameric protein [Planctomycetia bacterium]|nr:Nif3-like dinuclear metal center hexameric protein [Planctomycetia bacterium]